MELRENAQAKRYRFQEAKGVAWQVLRGGALFGTPVGIVFAAITYFLLPEDPRLPVLGLVVPTVFGFLLSGGILAHTTLFPVRWMLSVKGLHFRESRIMIRKWDKIVGYGVTSEKALPEHYFLTIHEKHQPVRMIQLSEKDFPPKEVAAVVGRYLPHIRADTVKSVF